MGYKLNPFTGEFDNTGTEPSFDSLSPTTTKGDLIVRDSTTNVRLPVGTDGQVLTADSTDSEGIVWADPVTSDPSMIYNLYEDFSRTATNSVFSQAGTVTYGQQDYTAGWRPGMLRIRTTSVTQSGIRTDNDLLRVGFGEFTMESSFFIQDLSTATDEYSLYFGLTDNLFLSSPNNGILLRYDRAADGVNWQTYTAESATSTQNDTGVAVTEDTWINLKIIVNSDASSVGFYINNTLVDTITTNIFANTVDVEWCFAMDRDVASGVVARDFWIDYVNLTYIINRQ